jgi:hypothetical protein
MVLRCKLMLNVWFKTDAYVVEEQRLKETFRVDPIWTYFTQIRNWSRIYRNWAWSEFWWYLNALSCSILRIGTCFQIGKRLDRRENRCLLRLVWYLSRLHLGRYDALLHRLDKDPWIHRVYGFNKIVHVEDGENTTLSLYIVASLSLLGSYWQNRRIYSFPNRELLRFEGWDFGWLFNDRKSHSRKDIIEWRLRRTSGLADPYKRQKGFHRNRIEMKLWNMISKTEQTGSL